MRLRKIKNAPERLIQDNNPYYIPNPEAYKGKWKELFGNEVEENSKDKTPQKEFVR